MPARLILRAAYAAAAIVGASVPAGVAAAGAAVDVASPWRFRFEWVEDGRGEGAMADARMDLGRVAATPAALRAQRLVLKKRVAVRVDGPASVARMKVALLAETPGAIVRVNGVPLSTIPRIVDAAHRVGAAVVHTFELTIPAGMAPGPLLTSVQWEAEAL